jgi:hypothetical protein
MKELRILHTKRTPEVILNPDGFIRIKGRSMVGDVTEFSKKINNWVDKYICNPAEITIIDFQLEYLPTFTTKFYISLVSKISSVSLKNKKISINWYYEEGDEDIFEKGEYISSHLNLPFTFIKISAKIPLR